MYIQELADFEEMTGGPQINEKSKYSKFVAVIIFSYTMQNK